MVDVLTNDVGDPLTLYRGEWDYADKDQPRSKIPAIYFGDVVVANRYIEQPVDNPRGKTPRIYPARLTIRRPFVNQPDDAFLELQVLVNRLGPREARRIAEKFSVWIEATDNWQVEINQAGKYKDVRDYLRSPEGAVERLYFQAWPFFANASEVGKLRRMGYDGAIHAGNGWGSEGYVEYCVFDERQIHPIFGRV